MLKSTSVLIDQGRLVTRLDGCATRSEDERGDAAPERDATAAFRESMARLVSGLAIVTCLEEEEPRGLLVSSLTALSLDPPRVLFCVGKAASCHNALLRAVSCAVAVLPEGDEEEAQRFADTNRTSERFTGLRWRRYAGEPPLYCNALATLRGPMQRLYDAGTHSVFLLEVATCDWRDDAPLAYFNRRFRRLAGG